MSLDLQVSGYDKRTERLSIAHPVPSSLSDTARRLARVGSDDDGEGAYPLEPGAARTLGLKLDTNLDLDRYDWFLEPRRDG